MLRGRPTLENISTKSTDSDVWSESDTIVPRRNLSVMDVAALIFNKMVGTGIFTTPGAVLALTKSKPISLVLWAVGGMYTLICVFMYLEYGTSLPFTGGELVYLDEAWPAPGMLSAVIFAGFFLILASSAGNAIAFAKHVLLAAQDGTNSMELDGRLVHFFAVTVVLAVCLLHYFSHRFGMFLNRVLALFKGLLLFSIFVAGVIASRKEGSGLSDFRHVPGKHANVDSIAALVLILYSYQGWENANYVAGEIRAPSKTLKHGAFIAVGLVTLLYLLVTTGYYLACNYTTITNTQTDIGMAVNFGPRAFGSSFGLKICIALSALGNLISVAFTSSKVKQAIASQRFIPFWKFLQKDINSPKGALVLHWLTTVVTIIVIPNNADGYNFIVGLFTYGHLMVTIFIALGLYRLHSRMGPNWHPEFLTNKYVYHVLPVLFIGINAIILGWGAKPNAPSTIPRYWWSIVNLLVFVSSALYWAVLRILQVKFTYEGRLYNIGSIVGFEVKIHNETDQDTPPHMLAAMVQSRLDGSRRRVEFLVSGTPAVNVGAC
ncbi:amino acid transporter [Glonium stellatum]|uniref:Amino acid transporter n=1 Tax=Glonium stellatum TaxID=574774 RepID=A0A8E2JX95_9PEZI|nr:amino acid transporter [Glonium stellatum]